MGGNDREVIARMVRLYNRILEPESDELRAELERVWIDEPELVPMRAALERNVYRGPGAVDDFRAAAIETWSELEFALDDIQGDGPRYLCSGTLRARGRESGAEFHAPLWGVVDVSDGRVARMAAYLDRRQALAEMPSDEF